MNHFFFRKWIAGLCLICLLFSLFLLPGCTETSSQGAETSPVPESSSPSEEAISEQTPEPTENPTPEPTEDPLEQIRTELVEFAKQYEGTKYSYGGWTPETGFDCSGLLYYTFRQFGYRISRVAEYQATNGEHVDREDLLPGDIVCFRAKGSNYIGHCGLYIGDGMFLQAMDSAHGIVITSLDEWLETRSLEARRIIGVLPQYSEEEMANFDLMDAEYAEEQARLKELEAAQKAAALEKQKEETGGAVPESAADSSSEFGATIHSIPTVEPIIDTPEPTEASDESQRSDSSPEDSTASSPSPTDGSPDQTENSPEETDGSNPPFGPF